MMDDVERIARAIEPQLDVVEAVDASAQHLRRLKAQRIARVALFAMSAEIDALRAEVERLTRERDDAEVRAGELRMCVNCGKTRPASEPKDDLPECTDPATGFAACTWDATPQEAWNYWRDEAHRKHERATAAEANAAAAREQVRKLREALERIARLGSLVALDLVGRVEGGKVAAVQQCADVARAALQGEG